MNKLSILVLCLAALLASCGGEDTAASQAPVEGDESAMVQKREAVTKGTIRQEGIEGRWKNPAEEVLEIQNGETKTVARSGVELRKGTYEVVDTSPCTQETDGPYLVLNNGVKTCYQIMRADADSLILLLSSARPPLKFSRTE
ncbi:MAG: hypothetical protein AB8F95_09695 [Bacteroidia bacterium]